MRYAIGDLQGQVKPLEALLAQLEAEGTPFSVWLTGDLVNRGPDNAETLRFVRALGTRATTVLGNHDFYLLGLACGAIQRSADDTLDDVLCAPDRDELIDWLRRRPLMHVEDNFALVHAGLLPNWTVKRARELAGEVEAVLQGPRWIEFLGRLWGTEPTAWRDDLTGWDRLRVIVNAMCRMRMCSPDGHMRLKYKGPLAGAPKDVLPWFRVPGRRSTTHKLVCGHWSALGYHSGDGILALDTGCVWGGCLTAVRLEDGRIFSVRCPQASIPNGRE
jgi:bis(5'-nucleosyl)-tetraphosphatase (symmetrical)